ncbi:MAG TPA: RimK family protein [Anaerolineae bacterium]|nr:RimK family protein [Anaerolineae bacterium]
MQNLIVVYYVNKWPLNIPNAEVITAKSYLSDPKYSQMKGVRVYNLSRSYRYQSLGYYVSLLAAARGHHPIPNVMAIQDMKSQSIIRFVSDELDDLIQKSLKGIQSKKFTLSIYFGRNIAKKYDRLSRYLFNLIPSPLIRAFFVYNSKWQLQNIDPLPVSEIPEDHFPFVYTVMIDYFAGKRVSVPKRIQSRYDLAILHDPSEQEPPSDNRALMKFIKAAETLGIDSELITREDSGRLLEFDALFIRETTSVHHHTYRLSRKAEAGGLVVIDDPLSILRCTNKVYLAELLQRYKIPMPRTMIMHKENMNTVIESLGLPCILKQPDSSFSQGVLKIESRQEFRVQAERLLEKSDLVIAQEYIPTPFDWRIGILDRQPLYVCKYYMAENHWQIIHRDSKGKIHEGKADTLAVENAPERVVQTTLKAVNLIGDGLYGVDVKEINGEPYIIEINDNPNIDSGVEDRVLKDALYLRIMEVFLRRLEKSKGRIDST